MLFDAPKAVFVCASAEVVDVTFTVTPVTQWDGITYEIEL